MRVGLLALPLALLLSGCGDDGKLGSKGPKGSPPKAGGPMDAWDTSPSVVQTRASLASWARTRPGDVATWEVRVKDSPLVTRLTWKALSVEEGLVHFEVESTTRDAEGRVVSSAVSRDERHPAGAVTVLPEGLSKPFEPGEVAGKRLRQVRQQGPRVEGVIITVSDEVPFGGLIRHRNTGIDHVLVDFTRAP